jgi:hypothetical protein
VCGRSRGARRGAGGGRGRGGRAPPQTPPPRNSEVLTKPSQIPMEKYIRNNLIGIRDSLSCKLSRTRDWGLSPPDPCSLSPLSSTEFVEPPPRKKFLGTPLVVCNRKIGCMISTVLSFFQIVILLKSTTLLLIFLGYSQTR